MTTYAYTIELTDYTFIALETLLKNECKKIEQQTGIVAYNPETGEAKHPLGEILKTMYLYERDTNARVNRQFR